MKYCFECGAQLAIENSKYCPMCGSDLLNEGGSDNNNNQAKSINIENSKGG